MKNIKIYQIYYNDEQKLSLSNNTIPYYNDKLTVYFENEIIKNLYDEIDSDYFGVLSWKFNIKNNITFTTKYIDGKYDMYYFTNNTKDVDVLGIAYKWHPYFKEIFSLILKNLDIDVNIKPTIGLYSNSVIASSDIYKKYIKEYLIPTMELLDTLNGTFKSKYMNDIREKLWSNSMYHHKIGDRLKEHTGKSFYTYHTFLCERLWSVFYEIHKDEFTLKIINTNRIKSKKPTV